DSTAAMAAAVASPSTAAIAQAAATHATAVPHPTAVPGGTAAPYVPRGPGTTALGVPAAEIGSTARAWSPRPGRGSTIGRLVLAGALLGPGLGVALGPWLAQDRLPLYEARAPWRGPAPQLGDWSRPPGSGEVAEAIKAGERTLLVARAPTAAGAEALALELALPRLSLSPELVGARD